jgi:hypothetical protein
MLEGVKIVIERLQMNETDDKWIYIAESILEDEQKIFSEQEKNELRNVYRTAKRKQFNAVIIDELAERSDKPKAQRQNKNKVWTAAGMQKEAQQLLDKEFDKVYAEQNDLMRKVNNYE